MVLIVHHLHMSQSERIVWLCEELGIDYELRTYDRAPLMAPPEYKALHLQGSAPVIQDGDLTLAESGACVEYIAHRHGGGRLFVPPSHPAYPEFLYWWHWSNGTFQPTSVRTMAARAAGAEGFCWYHQVTVRSSPCGGVSLRREKAQQWEGYRAGPGCGAPGLRLTKPGSLSLVITLPWRRYSNSFTAKLTEERFARALRSLDERLRGNKWLAGEDFTAADIMVIFTLTTWRFWFRYGLAEDEGILGYLKRVGQREAYRRAMEKGDPGMELALGPEPPQGDRAKELQR